MFREKRLKDKINKQIAEGRMIPTDTMAYNFAKDTFEDEGLVLRAHQVVLGEEIQQKILKHKQRQTS